MKTEMFSCEFQHITSSVKGKKKRKPMLKKERYDYRLREEFFSRWKKEFKWLEVLANGMTCSICNLLRR